LGCPKSSCRFLVGGVRTGLNISERLKTNDMRTYRKRLQAYLEKNLVAIRVIFISYTPLNMEENKVHFRYLMLFFCRKGKNVTQAANKICAVYDEGTVAERTVRKWFARFKAGDFNLKHQKRSRRPFTTDEDQIKTLIENNLRYTTRKVAEMLNMSKSTIHEHFVKLGYINRFDICMGSPRFNGEKSDRSHF